MRCDPRIERDARRPIIAPDLVLALDQGTTSSRAALVDADGTPDRRAAGRRTVNTIPGPGLVEHDPIELLDAIAVMCPSRRSPRSRSSASRASESRTSARRSSLWDRSHGPARRQRDRLAGHSHRRSLRQLVAGGARGARSRAHGSADSAVLLGDEARLAARRSPRGARAGPNEASSRPARSNAGSPGG